jgi:hypothetical protein
MTMRKRFFKTGAVGVAIAGLALLALAATAGCEVDDSLPGGAGEQFLSLTCDESDEIQRGENASLELEGTLAARDLEKTPGVAIGRDGGNPWLVHYAADSEGTHNGNGQLPRGPKFDPNPIPATGVQEAVESDSQGSDGVQPPSVSGPRLSDPNPIPAGL